MLIFFLLLMTSGIDLMMDFSAGTDFNHVAQESAVFALSFIALGRLLLKGLSLKEIAAIRETLEKTVRQQVSSIYKKAELSGRHAFSAWFIEDAL